MSYHLKNIEKFAETAILVGDPDRAKLIASYLKNKKIISSNRGMVSYNGTYANKNLSVQTTGIGCPSASIIVEELIKNGVKKIIRLGSCCSIKKNDTDLFLVNKVFSEDGVVIKLSKNSSKQIKPKHVICDLVSDAANKYKINTKQATAVTVDVFYNPYIEKDLKRWSKKKIDVIDMETSAICYLAEKHKIEAEALLVKSDYFDDKQHFVIDKKIFEKKIKKTIKLILKALC